MGCWWPCCNKDRLIVGTLNSDIYHINPRTGSTIQSYSATTNVPVDLDVTPSGYIISSESTRLHFYDKSNTSLLSIVTGSGFAHVTKLARDGELEEVFVLGTAQNTIRKYSFDIGAGTSNLELTVTIPQGTFADNLLFPGILYAEQPAASSILLAVTQNPDGDPTPTETYLATYNTSGVLQSSYPGTALADDEIYFSPNHFRQIASDAYVLSGRTFGDDPAADDIKIYDGSSVVDSIALDESPFSQTGSESLAGQYDAWGLRAIASAEDGKFFALTRMTTDSGNAYKLYKIDSDDPSTYEWRWGDNWGDLSTYETAESAALRANASDSLGGGLAYDPVRDRVFVGHGATISDNYRVTCLDGSDGSVVWQTFIPHEVSSMTYGQIL